MEARYSQPTLGVISSESGELQVKPGQDYSFDDNDQLPYILLRNLGHGHSVNVEKIQDRCIESVYARKVFRICNPRDERKRIFDNEIKVIQRLESHHHVICTFATYVAKGEVGLSWAQ
ncbi:hypothetical protein CC80DRAFT_507035 [Byssothecium circinans]|uniref:Protein kinase domain-containing protein n=1 Tax=Byssothecium circinans TaxID=147558 RepID=A0A6A5TS07_9PLEO|nr:hypothetical protein CC80DRAFT_507035 [Byssothecium circinans]